MRSQLGRVVVLAAGMFLIAGVSSAKPPCIHCNNAKPTENYHPHVGHSDHRSWVIYALPLDPSSGVTQRFANCLWNDGESNPHHSKADTIWMSKALGDSVRFANRSKDTCSVEFTGMWPFIPSAPGNSGSLVILPGECSIPYMLKDHGSTTHPGVHHFHVYTLKHGKLMEPMELRRRTKSARTLRPTEVGPVVASDG